jgi:hypothetical protein
MSMVNKPYILTDKIAVISKGITMRKFILAIVLVALLLSACSIGRDLSTPSSRLVGHWKALAPTGAEYYFSEIDPETGEGIWTEYDPRDGTTFICKYVVVSEAPEGEEIAIFLTAADGYVSDAEFVMAKDGLFAKMHSFTIQYLDDKTEY